MLFPVLIYLFGKIAQPFTERVKSPSQLSKGKIKIELRLNPGQLKDSGTISFKPANYILLPKPIVEIKKPDNGLLSLTLELDGAAYLDFSKILHVNKCGYYLTEPGDQVQISSNGEGFHFSGQGFEKYWLQYQLDSVRRSIPKPSNPRDYNVKSKDDYFEYTNYLQREFDCSLYVLNNYKGKISDFAFDAINTTLIRDIISRLNTKFYSLQQYIRYKKIPTGILAQIYDTSFSITVKKWLSQVPNKEVVGLQLRRIELDRKFSFDTTGIMSNQDKSLLLWKDALKLYKGQERERFIVNTFPKQIMNDIGFIPQVEKLLADYYAESEYPEWKKWMKEQELKIRRSHISQMAPSFSLTNSKGKIFNKEEISGKFVILHFWKSGSAEDVKMIAAIKKLNEQFKQFIKLVIVNISVDNNKKQWLYTIATQNIPGIHLYTNGAGISHDIIRQYAVTQYPTIWLIHPKGGIVNAKPIIDFTIDNGLALKEMLAKYLIALPKDGPYVWHTDSASVAYHIHDSIVTKNEFTTGQQLFLPVQSDLDHSFQVRLQASLSVQPSVYARPQKLLALSDIEGNFDAFRKLLQTNGVIDQQYNWIFGKGHLVFAGDMFDRGNQVTECLWLLYSLEEKAKAAGGYVHFVLGNHEIMNMQGNHKYVQLKYRDNAALMKKSLSELYNEDSELGRWLRTKNVIEKIGDLLFVHGGISHQVRSMGLTLNEMNDLVRPYYAKEVDSTNHNLVVLYGSKRTGPEKSYTSPFWFRGYYGDTDNPHEIPTMNQLDSTLQKFGVNHIITGHTLIADTISVRYNGKVINTDTHHANGKSEALLIEGNFFYRVDTKGQKVLLWVDDSRNTIIGFSAAHAIAIE